MQYHISSRPRKISIIVASIATSFNLLVALFIGFILFYAYAVGDPASDNVNFETFYSQKARDLFTVKLLILGFIIIFLVSFLLWLPGKRFSDISFLSITLLHACGIVLFREILFPMLVLVPLTLDLVILVVIFLEKKYHLRTV
jgi:hypothetical protein